MDARVGLWRKLSAEELMLLNCGVHAKLLPSCPTLCDPIDGSPPGSPVPEILQVTLMMLVQDLWFKSLLRNFDLIACSGVLGQLEETKRNRQTNKKQPYSGDSNTQLGLRFTAWEEHFLGMQESFSGALQQRRQFLLAVLNRLVILSYYLLTTYG